MYLCFDINVEAIRTVALFKENCLASLQGITVLTMMHPKPSTRHVIIAALVLQGMVQALADTSASRAYLDCVDAAVDQGLSTDTCCFQTSSPTASFASLSPSSMHCQPPFGFCHQHMVGYSFDKPSNFQVASGGFSIAFYRCGGYREPCSEVCSNGVYNTQPANSGQARAGDACIAFELDADIMAEYAMTLRRWDFTVESAAP